MKFMGVNELREKFLSFFEQKGHLRLPSFSLIPQSEKSLLLINSGMAPMKPWFSGAEEPPSRRVTTCQKCIRTPDIERVGKTARHGTFFEMLGNFSFGDYFKREAIIWAWEFFTQVLEIPAERLYCSVYLDDDEAYDIWTKEVGVDPSHMVRFGKEDNFWEIGAGPCGPCSEIYIDRGEEYGCGREDCKVGCECDRFVELWNLVFTQFNNDGQGNYTPLPQKNIDTGMGLERLACALQGVSNLFEVDTVKNIMSHVSEIAGVAYRASEKTDVSLRVITDHVRSTTMLIADGVLPSNEGRGYVLRRLLRRAARHGKLLGIDKPFLYEVCATVIRESKDAYPELAQRQDAIIKVIRVEEERFAKTIDAGLALLNEKIEAMLASEEGANGTFPGSEAFRLYDTFGFPIDLTEELLEERGLKLDRAGFDECMNEQRMRARTARSAAGDFGWAVEETTEELGETKFVGYTETEAKASIIHILADGEERGHMETGETAILLLDQTPFYAESGGQTSDHGTIESENGAVFVVSDVKKAAGGQHLHFGTVQSGSFSLGETVTARIDTARRKAIARAHSATHLLHKALQDVLGAHVQQAGSLVEPDRLRFDFSHFEAMKPEEIAKVEQMVNEQILEGLAVSCSEMSLEQAKEQGVMALFGEKYGDMVRVVRMGDFSAELCGGTHLDNTAKAGVFRIVSESSVAAGVRRMEAVTGTGVLTLLNEAQNQLSQAAEALKIAPGELVRRVTQLNTELRAALKEKEALAVQGAKGTVSEALANVKDIQGVNLATIELTGLSPDILRRLGDELKSRNEALAAVFSLENGEKLQFLAVATKAAIQKGVHAGQLVKAVASLTGGNGGGRPDSALAGGKELSKKKEALSAVPALLEKMIK
jgi:alanyl-tRNA synthetase